jgi:hypothetical protein
MNYARIYAEFIRDRKSKQPTSPEYFETHHIQPRCLGGGNEPDNLIRLTPEDHMFAHILLAWMHGGRLWSALFLMKGRQDADRGSRQGRVVYGIARRRHAEIERGKDGLKGADNGNYNSTVFRWVNLDSGERRAATLHEMWAEFGGLRGSWTSAATPGSGKPSAFGWAIDSGRQRLRSSKGKQFEFVNRDGRSFLGTQREFCTMAGLSAASGSRIVRGQSVTACGWRLKGTRDRHHFARKADGKPSNLGTGKVYVVSKAGRVVRGRRAQVARVIGCTAAQFSAGANQIASGVMRTYKGWQVQWQEQLL